MDAEITRGAVRAPIPAWVDLAAYAHPQQPNPHFIAGGLCALLDDTQVDLCGPERATFSRRADLVTAAVGAERVAQFSVSFDPSFERLEIHTIRVFRNGQTIDHLGAAFEVLRREQNLERLIFDGHHTIHCTLPDVRPGDVVEASFTRYGMRQSLRGRHSSWVAFEWPVGILEVRVRQRAPAARAISERPFNDAPEPTVSEQDGVIDRRWRAVERREVKFEQLAPLWIHQHAGIQFSEWRDWAEVADSFTALYEDAAPLPAEVDAEIARIEALNLSPTDRAAECLRFAQHAIRYLAISIGEGGFTPRSIADICKNRYGDCKDKTKLFVAMARRLGVSACPALVNTRSGYALDSWLPSAEAFDHCIARVEIDGVVYWLDPTRTLQPSPLPKLNQCHFGWALPLRTGADALERMPDPSPAHTLETHELITLGPSPRSIVRYEWRTTSRRGRAEWVRDQIAREGLVGMFKLYASDVSRLFANASPVRQEVLTDNPALNEVTTLEAYEIAEAWTPSQGHKDRFDFGTLDLSMKQQLAPLDAGPVKHPIYLGQVGRVTRRVEIVTANEGPFSGWNRSIEGSTLSFKNEFRKEGPQLLVLELTLEMRALTLPAAEADKYRAITAELERCDVLITESVGKDGDFIGANPERSRSGWQWLAWLVTPAAIFLVQQLWRLFNAQ